MLDTFKVTLVGVSPLLMHSGRLADPTNPHTIALRELTKKRNKTEDDLLEIRRAEWRGGLYTDGEEHVCVEAEAVLAATIAGARKSKLGKQAQAGIFETKQFYPLVYEGPKDLDKLYADGRFCDYRSVVIQRNRTMRARPVFPKWKLPIELNVNRDIIDLKDVRRALEISGEMIGLLEYRPRFGRFYVEE